jgi:hypothetical protein
MSLVYEPISLLLFEKSGAVEVLKDLLKFYQESDVPLRLDVSTNNQNHPALVNFLESTVLPSAYPPPDSAIRMDPEKRRRNMYYRLFGIIMDGNDDFPRPSSYYYNFKENFESILQQIQIAILQGANNVNYQGIADSAALADSLNELRDNYRRYYYSNNIIQTTVESYTSFLGLFYLLTVPPPPPSPPYNVPPLLPFDYSQILMTALNIRSNQIDERLTDLAEIVNIERERRGQDPLNVSRDLRLHLVLGLDISLFLLDVTTNPNWNALNADQYVTVPANINRLRAIINNWKKIVNPDFVVNPDIELRSVSNSFVNAITAIAARLTPASSARALMTSKIT